MGLNSVSYQAIFGYYELPSVKKFLNINFFAQYFQQLVSFSIFKLANKTRILRLTQFPSSIRQNQLKPIAAHLKTVTKIVALVNCLPTEKKAFKPSIELFFFFHQFEVCRFIIITRHFITLFLLNNIVVSIRSTSHFVLVLNIIWLLLRTLLSLIILTIAAT